LPAGDSAAAIQTSGENLRQRLGVLKDIPAKIALRTLDTLTIPQPARPKKDMATLSSKTLDLKSGETVTVRSAQPADAERLLAYIRSVAGETPFFILQADEFNFTDEQERQWIQEHLDDPGKLAISAEISGTIVGFLSFENGPHRRVRHRGTFGISVEKPWRGKGIGAALLQCLIEWGEASPLIEKIGLSVFANNENAIRLYKRFGFVEEGRRPKELKIGPDCYAEDILMYRFV
jgi:RimJ/RimL family protein N-acetyltransferase